MTQNIYDNDAFFTAYSRLPRSVAGLDGAPEWPSLRGLLPALENSHVLDLGCGFGWFTRWVRRNGAERVVGVDVSERMLARAIKETDDPAVSYLRADLETFQAGAETFDLVYSSLALHYIADLKRLLTQVHAALVPGGRLVFSVEHPMLTAPARPGWSVDPAGRPAWPVNRYLDEGPRSTDWLADGVIKQHRTVATYINLLLDAGFAIERIEEWGPNAAQIEAFPQWADDAERPIFLLVACGRE